KVPIVLHPEVEVSVSVTVGRNADEAERLARGEDIAALREAEMAEDAAAAAEAFFDPEALRAADEEAAEAAAAAEAPKARSRALFVKGLEHGWGRRRRHRRRRPRRLRRAQFGGRLTCVGRYTRRRSLAFGQLLRLLAFRGRPGGLCGRRRVGGGSRRGR